MRRTLLLVPGLLAAADDGGTTDLRVLLGTYAGYDRISYTREDQVKVPDRILRDGLGRDLEVAVVHVYPQATVLAPYVQFGGALRYARGTDDTGEDHHVLGAGLQAGFGACIRPHPRVQLELGPTLTVGYIDAGREDDANTPADESTTDQSLYVAADLRAGAWWTIGRFQIGAVAGVAAHLHSASDGDASHPWVSTDYSGSGGFVLVGAGVRL